MEMTAAAAAASALLLLPTQWAAVPMEQGMRFKYDKVRQDIQAVILKQNRACHTAIELLAADRIQHQLPHGAQAGPALMPDKISCGSSKPRLPAALKPHHG
jgi:hypothetical protein